MKSEQQGSGVIASLELVGEGLMTIAEASSFLRLSRASLYRLMERGELAFVTLGRARRLPVAAVKRLAAAGLVAV